MHLDPSAASQILKNRDLLDALAEKLISINTSLTSSKVLFLYNNYEYCLYLMIFFITLVQICEDICRLVFEWSSNANDNLLRLGIEITYDYFDFDKLITTFFCLIGLELFPTLLYTYFTSLSKMKQVAGKLEKLELTWNVSIHIFIIY